jgi:hypothetical protein
MLLLLIDSAGWLAGHDGLLQKEVFTSNRCRVDAIVFGTG